MSQPVFAAMREGTARLLPLIGRPAAEREMRLILTHVTGWSGARLTTSLQEPLPEGAAAKIDAILKAREARQSLAHILGKTEFYGREFTLVNGDLAPRSDTETLIERALTAPFQTLLDLGTGTGIIALTLLAERPGTTALATDLTEAALTSARRNAEALGLAARIRFQTSDWFDAIAPQRVDLITCNPPYISATDYDSLAPEIHHSERREALTPEGDGLAPYRRLANKAARYLTPNGRILVEIGHDQGESVPEIFRAAGLASPTLHHDINTKPRVVEARHPNAQ